MNDKLALIIAYLVFVGLTVFLGRLVLRLKIGWFAPIFLLYLTGVFFYIDFLDKLHHYLRDRGFYIDLGHADIGLFLLMIMCFATAFVFIAYTIYKKIKKAI